MKKLILFVLLTCLYKTAAFGQAFEWARIQGDTASRDIAATTDGVNMISAGIFFNQITMGSQTFNKPGFSQYLAKHDTYGHILWAKHIIGPTRYNKISLDTDLNNNILVAGYYHDSLYIDNLILSGLAPGISTPIGYLAKFDASGNLDWAKQLPFIYGDYNLTTDGVGNIYLTGVYRNSTTFGSVTLPAPANIQDVFFIKYNAAGVLQWAKNLGGTTSNYFSKPVGRNTDGLIMAHAYYSGSGTSYADGTKITKYDAAGNSIWQKTVPGLGPNLLTIDKDENIYVSGIALHGTYQFDQIQLSLYQNGTIFNDWYQAKLNTSGTWLWAKKVAAGNFHVKDLRTAPKVGRHNLSFTGGYSGTPDLGSSVSLPVVSGPHKPFYLQLDTAGNAVHAFKYGASTHTHNESLATDSGGNNYLAGIFIDSTRLGSITLVNPNSTGGWSMNSFTAKLLNKSNQISGNLFVDANGNGIKDATELPYKAGMLRINPGSKFVSTDNNGNYAAFTSAGTHTIEVVQPDNHYIVSPGMQTLTFAGNGQTQTRNFALSPIPNRNDVKVTITNFFPVRPGGSIRYIISYENVGTTTLSDTIKFFYPNSQLQVNHFSVTPDLQLPGRLEWAYTGLQPQERRQIIVNGSISTSLIAGNIIQTIALVKPFPDFVTWNNTDTLNLTVVASFDPNDKQVNKATISSANEYLDYTIRFQNTGTDTAFTVIIRDAITSKLFIPSMELLSASHNYTFKLLENNVAEWHFDNILLPDSTTNEPASHGFVRFRMKPQSYLQLGDSITNSAAIYFDYNAPIITNTAVTRISQPLGLKEEKAGLTALYLYPNPATEILTVEAELKKPQATTIILRNVLGQEVYRKQLESQQQINQKINISQLPKGVYVVQLQIGQEQISKRVVIL